MAQVKSKPVRILGIDPGTAITGFGVIDYDGRETVMIDAGVIRTQAKIPDSERLLTIYSEISEIIKDNNPDHMAVEKLFFAQNVTTAMTVSQARGVVLLAGQQHNLALGEYTPLQIKQAVTGYGKAEKHQIQEMVKTILKLKAIPKPDDCADALAVAICHTLHIKR